MIGIIICFLASLLFIILSTAVLRMARSRLRIWINRAISLLMLSAGCGIMYLEASGLISGWALIPASFALVWFIVLGATLFVFSLTEMAEVKQEERYLQQKNLQRKERPLQEADIEEGINWDEVNSWLAQQK